MAGFQFIEDEALRELAERFWYEATEAKEKQLWFATGALSGACVEVVLIAIFEMLGEQPDKLDKLPLGGIIKQLNEVHGGHVPEHIISIASATKDCRNLFHPGKARNIGMVEREEAQATYNNVELMLKGINQYAKERFSVGARHLAEKVYENKTMTFDKVLEFKDKMSVKQWQLLPKEIEKYNEIMSAPSLITRNVFEAYSKPVPSLPDVRIPVLVQKLEELNAQ